MIKGTKKKTTSYLDAADVPIHNPTRPIYDLHTDSTRPNVKLRSLVDQGKYVEARTLFIEIVKSNKYHFKNLWRIGIEIIGKSSPKDLLGYLKAVYISSPPIFSTETFNVYMDQMILEEQWEEALEEMQIRYDTPLHHHPILLRKMAICSYNIWKKARNNLSESYFDEDERDPHDLQVIKYEKSVRIASKYVSEAHHSYLRDAELLHIYFDFLETTDEFDIAKKIVLESLKAYEEDPEYYLLCTLIRINRKLEAFRDEDYILQLYELDPYLSSDEMNLDTFCRDKCIEIIKVLDDVDSTIEELEKAYELSLSLFNLYIYRLEHGNPEDWFQEIVMELFNSAMSPAMVSAYHNRQVDTLLRSAFVRNKFQEDWTEQIDLMKDLVEKFSIESSGEEATKEDIEVDEDDQDDEIGEDDESYEYEEEEDEEEDEMLVERESFMD